MTRRALARALAAALAALPAEALAHATERGVVMTLPTGYYFWAGAAAVVLTFLVSVAVPRAALVRLLAPRRILSRRALRPGFPLGGIAGLAVAAALLAAGWLGPADPGHNALPLAVWTLWWVGFTLACAAFGDLWRGLNPWRAPMWALRRAGLRPLLRLPRGTGRWPAIAAFGAFAWFELVSLAPTDPATLATACLAYWAFTLAAMILFGEARWRRQGECFAVFFALVGRLAPLRRRAGRLSLALPGGHAAAPPALDAGGAVFLLLAVASVTFDGFRETFLWLSAIGINPLEFPGRSAVTGANSAGLLLAAAALGGAFALAVAAGLAFAGARGFRTSFARLAISLVPIALGYHVAHYLTQLLVESQMALELATDPLGTGADLLGLGPHFVTTSFLYDHHMVERIWQVQSGAIVLGHLVAVVIARRVAVDLHPHPRAALLAEAPLAALMVGYTLLGLWLLSTAVA